MSRYGAGWRAALRMARRDAVRSKGRSTLVAVMVGTPVLLTVLGTTIAATGDVTAEENLPATVGASQARVSWGGGTAGVVQAPDGVNWTNSGEEPLPGKAPSAAVVSETLDDARLVPLRTSRVSVAGAGSVEALETDLADPATKGLVALSDGRLPSSGDEVVVSPGLARALDVEVGDATTIHGDVREVVGLGTYETVAQDPDRRSIVALPEAELVNDTELGPDYLVVRDTPVTWDDVKALNRLGFLVASRDVIENPPPASAQYDEIQDWSNGDQERAIVVIIVTAVVIQVVLLAGPAFAVGVRRQLRELALVAASGGTPSDVRRIVLAQAVVVGAGACLVAAALGVALAPAVIALIPHWFDDVGFGPFDVWWPPLVAAVVLGTASAVLAALAPARQVAKQDVAAVLAGRPGAPRGRNGWPLVGVLLIAAGLGVCFTSGIQPGGETAVAGGTIAVVLGAVFLTPLLIGLVGRVGAVLPLPLRLAVRDTARQRARSAPAIAAVMATVAGITALAIASASDFEESRRMYEYVLPDGVTTLSSSSALPEAMSRATKASGVTFTPIGVAGSEGTADGGAYAYVSLESGDEDMWSGYREVAVATPEQLAAWGVELSPTEADALARGDALVGAASRLDPDGTVRLVVDAETEDGSPSPSKRVVLDGATADLGLGAVPQGQEPEIARVVISPEVARTNGIPVSSMVAIADRSAGPLTTGQRRDIRAAVKGVSEGPYLYTERGFQETYTLQLLLLLGAGGLAVLIGTLTATGLALVDARPDFATLAAVGAAPRTRRIVAAAQAAVLGVLGALLGVAVGFAPGLAATWPLTSERWGSLAGTDTGPIIAIPWGVLAAIVLIVPMVAAVASAVFTRGTLPLARRLAQ